MEIGGRYVKVPGLRKRVTSPSSMRFSPLQTRLLCKLHFWLPIPSSSPPASSSVCQQEQVMLGGSRYTDNLLTGLLTAGPCTGLKCTFEVWHIVY